VFAINLDIGDIVLKDGWDVDLDPQEHQHHGREACLVEYREDCSLLASAVCLTGSCAAICRWDKGGMLTSGKVPFEKTLFEESAVEVFAIGDLAIKSARGEGLHK
jgi:hypothetical protein